MRTICGAATLAVTLSQATVGRISDGGPVEKLILGLGAAQPEERAAAAQTLGHLTGPDSTVAIPDLIRVLEADSNGLVRSRAAEALGHLGEKDERVVAPLAKALTDPDLQVRVASATALGSLGPRAAGAVPVLAQALEDPDPLVRREAAAALGKMGPATSAAVPALERVLRGPNPSPSPQDPHVTSAPGDVRLRELAAHALGQAGHGTNADLALIEALQDPDGNVREAAVHALGVMGPAHADHAVPALRKVLQADPEASVRISAVFSLRSMRASGVAALAEALSDGEFRVRWWAAVSLRDLGPQASEAVPALTRALQDKDASVRDAAQQALNKIRDPGASPSPPAGPMPRLDPSPAVSPSAPGT